MTKVEEQPVKITVEEAFKLTKDALLFTISDNEDKTTFSECLGIPKENFEKVLDKDLIMKIMTISNKHEVVKLILERSNSLAETLFTLYGVIEAIGKLNSKMGTLFSMLKDEE